MQYLTKFEKWKFPWSSSDDEPDDLKSIVENELESNSGTVMVAFRFGRQIKGRTIIIPLEGGVRIVIKRVGSQCQIKKNKEIIELDKKEFNRFWNKCIEKKYKFILK